MVEQYTHKSSPIAKGGGEKTQIRKYLTSSLAYKDIKRHFKILIHYCSLFRRMMELRSRASTW